MSTQTFDDGSTLTIDDSTGAVSSTQSPPGYLVTDYSENFKPANASAGATSWMDVLKYGFGRVIDYKTASLQSANTPPQYASQSLTAAPSGGVNASTLLVIGVGVLVAMFVFGGSKKG